MKESHRKGVANRPDPESCVASREAAIEELTGANVGWVLSCEIIATGVATSFCMAEDNTGGCAIASAGGTPRSLRPQAWETPRARTGRPHRRPPGKDAAGRLEKALSRKPSMYVNGESDGRTVSAEQHTVREG